MDLTLTRQLIWSAITDAGRGIIQTMDLTGLTGQLSFMIGAGRGTMVIWQVVMATDSNMV